MELKKTLREFRLSLFFYVNVWYDILNNFVKEESLWLKWEDLKSK